ncbi:MAG: recombinase RecD [Chlamydiae bacterium RIFCSPHIGHO2_12_FULL_49_9]|nr:MAG: recombinase RecD [Chlamydiae bacterium RIFCSPHIGHO2_12_FULL_49_9]
MDELTGYIEAIVYTQPENGFTVARLKESKKKDYTVIVGYLPTLQPGETVFCKGSWKNHPTHGKQFEVSDYTVESPSDVIGIQKYLESGLVKGIGPVYAKKIVDRFGVDTLNVIDNTPHRLLEIEGLGRKKVEKLKECWQQQRAIREVMVFLRAHGVSPGYAQKIYKAYGDASIEKVKENPYQLARDIFGVGFKMADAVALKIGFALHSPERITAGIEFVLWELTNDGHTCYPFKDFVPLAKGILEVEETLIETQTFKMVEKQLLIHKEGFIWLKPYFAFEQGISRDLMRLIKSPQAIRPIDTEKAASWVQGQLSIQFAEQQKEAVIKALTDKVHIITGGPGTGKSTITNAILTITSKLTDKIFLAAPTGRAAKRLTQITRKKAFTIHALLEMDFASGGFKKGRDNQLDCDLLVIDEASMIDTPLLFHLLRAIPSRARLLFVGDIDQLPSVGAGTVLRDLITSDAIGVTRLTEIFRQAKGSKIITNAHRINHGEFPEVETHERSDFHFIEAETPEAIQQVILQLVSKDIPRLWHFDPFDSIQVLSPMKRGVIGAEMLNDALQTLLNPSDKPLFRSGGRFHVNDKVMQIRNNYDKKVYNGDIGRIIDIDSAEQTMNIAFDDKLVSYEFAELDEIVLAYATSVHKYQGSECPCIVMPIHTSHFKLLHRNLLYTAVTRGKRQVYLVGTKKAIGIAVGNDQVQKRYTGLEGAIKEMAKTFKLEEPTHHQMELI